MYNAIIKDLMKERDPQIVVCVDKLAVRDWVQARVPGILIPLIYASKTLKLPDQYPCAIKCTHDSGSCVIARTDEDVINARAKIKRCLGRVYGVEKGEWAYSYVPPMVICEELLDDSTDYKFHCSGGKVRWVQVIWNRPEPKEAIFMPDGTITDLHMDEKMQHCPDFVRPWDKAWQTMIEIAQILSAPFKYVRVDLYWSGKPYFGEMTFWPRHGEYKSKDEPKFGEMLWINTASC